jgi:putative endonuclease
VWFDETNDVNEALTRERQIKEWRRQWKVDLIESANPDWLDLAVDWYG